MIFKKPKNNPNIWATFVRKFASKNFQKQPNLVTLNPTQLGNLLMPPSPLGFFGIFLVGSLNSGSSDCLLRRSRKFEVGSIVAAACSSGLQRDFGVENLKNKDSGCSTGGRAAAAATNISSGSKCYKTFWEEIQI